MKKRNSLRSVVALILVAVLVLGLVASAFTMTVHAASSSEIQSQIDTLKSEASAIAEKKADLETQISSNESEKDDALAAKAVIDQEITVTLEEIANTSAQIEQYKLLIEEKTEELTAAEEAEATLYEEYGERIRAMEESGSVSYWAILFQASSFSDLLDRIDMIQEIAASDQTMMEELAAASADIADARTSLEDSQIEMEEQQVLLEEQQATLETQSAEAQTVIDELTATGVSLLSTYESYEAMEAELSTQIATAQVEYDEALAAEEAARLEAERLAAEQAAQQQQQAGSDASSGSSSSGSSSSSSSSAPSGSSSSSGTTTSSPSTGSSSFISPLSSYYISCAYGPRTHPIYGYDHFHGGVDMAAAEGTPVYATASGTVTTAAYHNLNGNYVMISHSGGYASAYLHMSYYTVSAGQYVTQGQIIGYVGSTGSSTGPHLDFRIYSNGATVNPMNYI